MYSKNQIFLMGLVVTLYSCSSLVENTRTSLLGDDKPRAKAKQDVKWVSKAQYDELMTKYKSLNERYENVKMQNVSSSDQLNQLNSKTQSTETVDVFGKNGIVNSKPKAKPTPVPAPVKVKNTTSVGDDLDFYKKAVTLKENGSDDEALKIFQFLENSKSKQISVRAKRHIGDIYFNKKQYDLALQVYEDVIRKNAFSAATLKALGKAALCAENLGLMDKKAQYESLLKDVFEMQV